MRIITWDKDDIQETISMLDEFATGTSLANALHINTFDTDIIKTRDAISMCKIKLMGEYHCILIKEDEKMLVDSEIYLLTWDGEASEGGEMIRLDAYTLEKIARETLFSESTTD
jgi:hypothetical protein